MVYYTTNNIILLDKIQNPNINQTFIVQMAFYQMVTDHQLYGLDKHNIMVILFIKYFIMITK